MHARARANHILGQVQDMIEHRGHKVGDPDLEFNIPGSKSGWKAKKIRKLQ